MILYIIKPWQITIRTEGNELFGYENGEIWNNICAPF